MFLVSCCFFQFSSRFELNMKLKVFIPKFKFPFTFIISKTLGSKDNI